MTYLIAAVAVFICALAFEVAELRETTLPRKQVWTYSAIFAIAAAALWPIYCICLLADVATEKPR